MIDTAKIYGNESAVGKAVKRAISENIIKREDVFITTKMWIWDFGRGEKAISASMKKLDLGYIDLMILHHSHKSNDVKAYKALEKASKDGIIRSIGLSNYYTHDDFDRIINSCEIPPAVLQNEIHPFHQIKEMKRHISKFGTAMESWFPLGGRGNTSKLFNDELIQSLSKKYKKNPAQIILRWHFQSGNISIPGSANPEHIKQNLDIFDFNLSDEDMEKINLLDNNGRFSVF